MLLLNIIENIEAWKVASARLLFTDIIRPHLSGLIALASIFLLPYFFDWFSLDLLGQFTLAAISISIFGIGVGTEYLNKIKNKLTSS